MLSWTGSLRAACLGALAGFVAGALLFGFGAWKWQAGNIADIELAHAKENLKRADENLERSDLALTSYLEVQSRADAAEAEAQTKITGLRADLAGARARFEAAKKSSPECEAWAAQLIACPL